jgi:hypothetical protein
MARKTAMTRRRKRSRKTAEHLGKHTMRRGLERYGIVMDAPTRAAAVRQIREGTGVFVERWSNIRSIWRVTLEEQELVVVYDKKRGEIATVLHPGDPRCGIQLTAEEKAIVITKIAEGDALRDSKIDGGKTEVWRVHVEPRGWLTIVYAPQQQKIRIARECTDNEQDQLRKGD